MRDSKAKKRDISPDPVYRDVQIAKFINYVMKDGKKELARSIVYEMLDILAKKTGQDALEAFRKAIDNVKPVVEVRSRRVGGANYQVPVPVPADRQFFLASKWIIESARSRSGAAFVELLADEFVSAFKGEGAAIKKKQDVEKMAEANKAFAHLRW